MFLKSVEGYVEKIAFYLGFEKLHRAHGHHIPRISRVLVVGGIGFIIQTSIFEVLGIWLKIAVPSTAAFVGALCAIMSNFLLNEHFSFRDAITREIPRYLRILKFYLVSSGSLLTQWICIFIAERISHDALFLNAAFIIGVGIGFIFNYCGYYFFVWKKH